MSHKTQKKLERKKRVARSQNIRQNAPKRGSDGKVVGSALRRAAMYSLLAMNGLGVFNAVTEVIDSTIDGKVIQK